MAGPNGGGKRPASASLTRRGAGGARGVSMAVQNRSLSTQQLQRAQADSTRFGHLGDEGAGIKGWHQMSRWAADYSSGGMSRAEEVFGRSTVGAGGGDGEGEVSFA